LRSGLIREKKRKADRQSEANDDTAEGKVLKKRKPRSDKGVKKSSAIAGLTGIPSDQNNLTSAPIQEDEDDDPPFDNDMNEEDIDTTLLSGSMTMCGSQIFHYGSSYHYPSGEYPTQEFANVKVEDDDDAEFNGDDFNFLRDYTGPAADFEVDENFFGQFEQDHEPTGSVYPPF